MRDGAMFHNHALYANELILYSFFLPCFPALYIYRLLIYNSKKKFILLTRFYVNYDNDSEFTILLLYYTYTLVGFGGKFFIRNKSTSQGLPYDFSSIMHFRHDAFSRALNESTVVTRNHTIPKTILGGSTDATDLDFLHINLLYCGGTDAITSYRL